MEPFDPEPENTPEPTTRHLLWIRANKTAAVAVVVALGLFGGHIYVWFTGHSLIAPFAMLVGLPIIAYVIHEADKDRRRLVYIWGIAAAACCSSLHAPR
jgi:hypothetical protein